MADIFTVIIQWVTTFPNYLIVAGVVVAYIIYTFYSKKGKREEIFEIEDFRESAYIETEKLLNNFGIDIDCYLVKGIEPLGRVSKFYHFVGEIQFEIPEEMKKNKEKIPRVDLWILRLGKKSIFDFIFGAKPFEYLIIDQAHIQPYEGSRKRWAVWEDVSFVPYGNCFITSQQGVDYLNDISFRRMQEEILTHTQNFPRKVSYLELKQAKVMERFQASIESKQSYFDKYKKDMLASDKEIEEDED